tara:strand:+ start:853 stop:1221 length:369 start_codon:yes stop_codon:yes gene_type:complete
MVFRLHTRPSRLFKKAGKSFHGGLRKVSHSLQKGGKAIADTGAIIHDVSKVAHTLAPVLEVGAVALGQPELVPAIMAGDMLAQRGMKVGKTVQKVGQSSQQVGSILRQPPPPPKQAQGQQFV